MLTVLGKPFLNLDQFLDVSSLDKITDDILLGIAKTRSSAGPSNSGPGYVDKRYNSVPEIQRSILGDPSHPYYNLMKDLSPVTFRYKPEFSDLPEETHYGLIAEDVHEVDPGNSLVIYKDGSPDSVKYENIPMHLVGAFKEMAKKIDVLQSRLDALEV
jgi:hypothetical protein